MAVLRHEEPDIVPVTVYTALMPRGSQERHLRNMGLCLVDMDFSVYGIRTPHVVVQTAQNIASFNIDDRYSCVGKQKQTIQRTYQTPVGTLLERYKWNYTLFEWPLEWAIKDLRDYETVKYVIEDINYFPSHEGFLKAEETMGEDGIVVLGTPRSPLQSMLLELMGYTKFSVDYYTHRSEFDDLYAVFSRKQLELYKVVADSPAEIVILGDNINGDVTSPRLFERYCMPFYQEVARILHEKGKIFGVHCDGKLKCLAGLIGKTDVDVIEGFSPPPMGDLSIHDAKSVWKGKIIWTTPPASLAVESTLDGVRKQTIEMLRGASPGDDFAIGITEDIGDIRSTRYADILTAITETVMKYGTYPISWA